MRKGETMEDRYLFKAKRIDNGEWVIGNLITNVFFRLGQSIPYILCPDKAEYDCFEDFTEENGIFEVRPDTICRCTGLRDKNGTLIWENDIINTQCGTIRRFDTMRTIFAEYNPQRNSIDVYTSAGYMLRIDCWEAEKNLTTTPGSDCALNALAIDEPLEYARLYLDGTMQMWIDAEDSF